MQVPLDPWSFKGRAFSCRVIPLEPLAFLEDLKRVNESLPYQTLD